MHDHHCGFCGSPYLECPKLDSYGHCALQPREEVDGKLVYSGPIVKPREEAA